VYGKDFEDELARHESRFPPEQRSASLLLALHAVQRRAGHVGEEAVHWLAKRYDLSPADVQGVVSFYTMFFDEPAGRHVIWLCRTFSCQLMGAGHVMRAFEQALGCEAGGKDASGETGLRWMECLAACDKAPCALVDDDMYECLVPEAVPLVLEHVKKGGGGGRIVVEGGKPRLVPLDVPRPAGDATVHLGPNARAKGTV
jgi:NADH-quinone oxidoreductase subunit E